eukprot:CAMPEP_0181296772 /NCGR_PEP_ID=MMETSP1101-20121128/4881_1 /TAXON_ID=46948 /ORGANISM="Rhodomonas abbreviata, Strain Caron Lab Isolate" /LENGTH=234 /DNA_ID=CAMNT_0023401657 /DNA_START=261 /DNA_END=962 /DNA_ORIENTATION=-
MLWTRACLMASEEGAHSSAPRLCTPPKCSELRCLMREHKDPEGHGSSNFRMASCGFQFAQCLIVSAEAEFLELMVDPSAPPHLEVDSRPINFCHTDRFGATLDCSARFVLKALAKGDGRTGVGYCLHMGKPVVMALKVTAEGNMGRDTANGFSRVAPVLLEVTEYPGAEIYGAETSDAPRRIVEWPPVRLKGNTATRHITQMHSPTTSIRIPSSARFSGSGREEEGLQTQQKGK